MLGAAHALANPLTRHFGVAHGAALSVTLPAVIRWNGASANGRYRTLLEMAGLKSGPDPADILAARISGWIRRAELPRTLRAARVRKRAIPRLAGEAAREWTGKFNPRPLDAAGAEEIYLACA